MHDTYLLTRLLLVTILYSLCDFFCRTSVRTSIAQLIGAYVEKRPAVDEKVSRDAWEFVDLSKEDWKKLNDFMLQKSDRAVWKKMFKEDTQSSQVANVSTYYVPCTCSDPSRRVRA